MPYQVREVRAKDYGFPVDQPTELYYCPDLIIRFWDFKTEKRIVGYARFYWEDELAGQVFSSESFALRNNENLRIILSNIRIPFQVEIEVRGFLEKWAYTIYEFSPMETINSFKQSLNSNIFLEILPLNPNRKDLYVENSGENDIDFYWGENSTWTTLKSGEFISDSEENKRALWMRAANGSSEVTIIERSEI